MSINLRTLLFIITFSFSASIFGESLESIIKIHEDKVAKAKKTYDASVEKTKKYTIKRLEALKKSTTRAGKLEDALKIQNEIKRLEGKLPENAAMAAEGIGLEGGVPVPPGEDAATFSERQAQRMLRKRYVEFHNALIAGKFDKALEYIDPTTVMQNDKQVIQGHLKIIAGLLQAFQVTKDGVDISRVEFTKKQKEAKILSKTRSAFSGKWQENKDPSYWIYKRGEWYLGDKAKLKELF